MSTAARNDTDPVHITRTSGNDFADLGIDPEEAPNLQLRSRLAVEITWWIEAEDLTQTEAAERLGVTQPRVSDLVRGKLDRFTVDALVNMLDRVGRRVEVRVGGAVTALDPTTGAPEGRVLPTPRVRGRP